MSMEGDVSFSVAEHLASSSEFLLVPHQYMADTGVMIWIGAYASDLQNVFLRFRKKSAENWEMRPVHFTCEAPGIRYEILEIPLEPGESHELELVQGGVDSMRLLDMATIRGKPANLEEGFTLWYGTCFYQPKDHGALCEAFTQIPEAYRPDATILGGDQVYLDIAYSDSSGSLIPGAALKSFYWRGAREDDAIREELCEIFTNEYQRNWTSGLRSLLRNGATYFLAGDHEFWNDYPNTPIFMPVLRKPGVRKNWVELASSLFRGYQRPQGGGYSQFAIGEELSVFALETRARREPGADAAFTDQATLDACVAWLRDLRCPGVLVLPAPLLTRWQFKSPKSIKARWIKWGGGDHSLADTGQYVPLVQALNDSSQDILIIAGDVHFSRQAEMSLNGKQVTEVVASPLSCLPTAVAKASEEPAVFPDRPIDGIKADVTYKRAGSHRWSLFGRKSQNNFVTVRFSRGECGVNADVVCWGVNGRDEQGRLQQVWSRAGSERIVLRHIKVTTDTEETTADAVI